MTIIVRENLFEFERGQEPRKALQLGGELKKIQNWLTPYLYTSQYKVNSDWTIDIVRGDFVAYSGKITHIPEFIQFNKCAGAFIIDGMEFDFMQGCPKTVDGDFHVADNEIKALTGSPEYVGGDYNIRGNPGNFSVADIEKICEVAGKIFV